MTTLLLVALMAKAPATPPAAHDGREFVTLLDSGQWDSASARLDPTMASALNTSKLRSVWTQLTQQLGPLQSIDGVETDTVGPYRRDTVSCTFARIRMDLQVTLNNEGQVAGFYVVPAKAEADAGWLPASYADTSQFTEKPVEVGPQRLGGMLTLPKGSAHFPIVVMLSGSGPNDMDESLPPLKVFRDLAQGLATHGIGSLRFEKRTHRQLPIVTVKEEYLDDAAAAITQAAAVPGATKVVLLGHSMGAMMVPRVALGNAQVAAAVMLAGSTWPYEKVSVAQLEYQKTLGFGGPTIDALIADAKAEAKKIADPHLKPDTKLSFGVRGAYYLDLRGYDAVATTGKLTIPVFLAWGDRDLKVIPTDWAGWRTALGERPNLTYRIYPGLQHMFSPVGTPDVAHVSPTLISDLASWIAK